MTPVNWERLPGDTVQDLVAALLVLAQPEGNQITASRGDRGIDVRIRTGGGIDVYQIKRYAAALKSRQASEIERSWAAFRAEGEPALGGPVRSWTLVMPWDPTNERLEWLDEFTNGCRFPVRWMGRTQLDVLAAERPDIVDYFLGDGANRVTELMAKAVEAGAAVEDGLVGESLLDAVTRRTQGLASTLDEVDPFYRYEIVVRHGPAPRMWSQEMVADSHSAFVTYEQLADDRHLVIRVLPRSPHSLWLRPITRTIQFEVEPGTAEHDAVLKFARFGAPVSGIAATTTAASGPPGTTDRGRSRVWFKPVPDGDTAYELRIVGEDGETVSMIELTNAIVSSGPAGGGERLAATDPTGVFTIEALFESGSSSLAARVSGWGGHPAAAVVSLARALAAARTASRFVLAIAGGPELADWPPPSEQPDLGSGMLQWIECLAVIQQHTRQTVRVPVDPTQQQVAAAFRAAAMVSGEVLTGRQQPFDFVINRDGATLPGAEIAVAFHRQIVVDLGDEAYVLDRLELVHCPRARVEGVDPGVPLTDGQTARLVPLADSTCRAVAVSATPAADHGPFA